MQLFTHIYQLKLIPPTGLEYKILSLSFANWLRCVWFFSLWFHRKLLIFNNLFDGVDTKFELKTITIFLNYWICLLIVFPHLSASAHIPIFYSFSQISIVSAFLLHIHAPQLTIFRTISKISSRALRQDLLNYQNRRKNPPIINPYQNSPLPHYHTLYIMRKGGKKMY